MISCLNCCGACGRAYNLPGAGAMARGSRARLRVRCRDDRRLVFHEPKIPHARRGSKTYSDRRMMFSCSFRGAGRGSGTSGAFLQGTPASPKTCRGSSSAAPSTSMSRMKTSTSPVGILGFTSFGSRAFTLPSMRITIQNGLSQLPRKPGCQGRT